MNEIDEILTQIEALLNQQSSEIERLKALATKQEEQIEVLDQQLSLLLLMSTEIFKTTDAFVKTMPLLGEDIWKAFNGFATENGEALMGILNHDLDPGITAEDLPVPGGDEPAA